MDVVQEVAYFRSDAQVTGDPIVAESPRADLAGTSNSMLPTQFVIAFSRGSPLQLVWIKRNSRIEGMKTLRFSMLVDILRGGLPCGDFTTVREFDLHLDRMRDCHWQFEVFAEPSTWAAP